jgi:hypothetical protein
MAPAGPREAPSVFAWASMIFSPSPTVYTTENGHRASDYRRVITKKKGNAFQITKILKSIGCKPKTMDAGLSQSKD